MVAVLSRPAFARRASARLVACVLLASSCSDRDPAGQAGHASSAPATRTLRAGAEEWFTDRARESGLDFIHFNGMTGAFHFPEVIPPGVALLDPDTFGPSRARELDRPRGARVLHPGPLAVGRHEPPLSVEKHELHGSRVLPARLTTGDSQEVRPLPGKPEAGSQWSRTESSRISMIPSQKFGIDTPQRDTPLAR